MQQDFDREVLSRLPLAEAVLSLGRFVGDGQSLEDLYDRHRGRTYQKKITFPLLAQLVRDALLGPMAPVTRAFATPSGTAPSMPSSPRPTTSSATCHWPS